MLRSIVMHQLDYNHIASSEEWYYRSHGPQIARRYGPWLERFESYRPVPLPADIPGARLGYTNWLTTVGFWRELPEEGPMGEMAMSSPKVNARNFSAFLPAQSTDDFKGNDLAPEEKACLRLVMLWQYPDGTNVQKADRFFLETAAKEISAVKTVYRFFSCCVMQEEIHLPGTWKPDQMEHLMTHGNPADHQWHRYAEVWFETFDDVRAFLKQAESFTIPERAQTRSFPYLEAYTHFVSTFLLERPAYDWMCNYNVYH